VISESLYSRVGFVPLPSYEWNFKPVKDEESLASVTKYSAEEVLKNWSTLYTPFHSTSDYFTVITSTDQLDLYYAIEANRYQATNRPNVNTARAVQLGKSIIVFETDIFYGNCSRLLHLHFADTASAIKLIKAVQSVTYDLNLKHFSLWEDVTQCDGKFDWNALSNIGGERLQREELVMIKSCTPTLKPEMWKQAFKSMLL